MSQERTEKATPKRREDARKKGQIARGQELPAALGFMAAVFSIHFLGDNITGYIGGYIKNIAEKVADPNHFSGNEVHQLMINGLAVLGLVSIPVVITGLGAGLAGNFAQGGLTLTTEAFKPKADKFNPAKNIKKIFGLDSVVNLVKSLFKLILLGAMAYTVLSPVIEKAPTLINAPFETVATNLGSTLYTLAFRCGLVMLMIALADYGYTLYKHEKSLRMSKQEIRDEFKEQEGDPMVKSQRRRAARALVQKRSLAEVPTASVVITNPTHISVALRYDREKDPAPMVVAKGADLMAARIREIAKENNVPLVENKPLARALYKMVEPNQMIPVEFFGAVAEILAFVFRQKEKS
ncbi:MAG: flagellar biosynthesis protein FlhB [Pyrinomonadaceae bacterium]